MSRAPMANAPLGEQPEGLGRQDRPAAAPLRVIHRMEEHLDFAFTSDQVVPLAWVEESDPELFALIRQRVAEGRWQLGRRLVGRAGLQNALRGVLRPAGSVRAALPGREVRGDARGGLQSAFRAGGGDRRTAVRRVPRAGCVVDADAGLTPNQPIQSTATTDDHNRGAVAFDAEVPALGYRVYRLMPGRPDAAGERPSAGRVRSGQRLAVFAAGQANRRADLVAGASGEHSPI